MAVCCGNNACGTSSDATGQEGPDASAGAENLANARISEYTVPKMDCPSEERMVRMALDGVVGIHHIDFDQGARRLRILHCAEEPVITSRLVPLGLGATHVGTAAVSSEEVTGTLPTGMVEDAREAGTLRLLLGLNAAMFLVELAIGWIAQSTSLVADSLDMFADAAVYGLSLYAVGKPAQAKLRAAHLAGWLQVLLALSALGEVLRGFLYGSEPRSSLMMGIGLLALAVNVICLLLIHRHREGGVHMKASWIFSANDVLANLGVMIAGGLVAWTGSNYPDLVIGTLIGLLVLNGGRRILKLRV